MSERNPTGLPKQADVIEPGDVVLDLAQGRPMQVIERAADSVEEWVDANDYDLLGNYGNARLGASVDDAVYTCVYVSNLKSEPSNRYDFPAARLGRVEVEAAHPDGERIQEVIRRQLLTTMYEIALKADAAESGRPDSFVQALNFCIDGVFGDVRDDAREIAEAETLLEAHDD
ncbi:hypothetical protein ACFPYI_01710 [Halomarina salina]|uniref:Uncharacterized protein n=1 Tax=Halomarina salina TaxID=1872699 RepID=A0ABD5RI56_9EURY|nr:hypothetical protein [Halomarina salina]